MKNNRTVEERRHALRLSKQACAIAGMIMQHYGVDEYSAIVNFYASETYKLLSDHNTKLWWYSVHALFEIYKTEKETGSALKSPYIFGDCA